MASSHKQLESIRCHQCGADNPPKAYCCLSCFKVLRPKAKVPWWRMYIRTSTPMAVTLLVIACAGLYVFKRWVDNVEAQVTMNFKGSEYKLSVSADKRKKTDEAGPSDMMSEISNPPTETPAE
jgi:ribosomal protein L40E